MMHAHGATQQSIDFIGAVPLQGESTVLMQFGHC
jgi:hypothetical protein